MWGCIQARGRLAWSFPPIGSWWHHRRTNWCCWLAGRRQAAETLIRDVLPWTLRMLPEGLLEKFRLHIVGANVVSEELKDLFRRNRNFVKFHGHLNDTQVGQAAWLGSK